MISLNSNRSKADVKFVYFSSSDFVMSIGEKKDGKHFHHATFHDQIFWETDLSR